MIRRISHRLWPELNTLNEQRQLLGSVEVVTVLYGLPLAIIGLGWLIASTNLEVLRQNWPEFLLFGGLIVLFESISYFLYFENNIYSYGGIESSLGSMVQWTAVFLLGPTVLWLSVLWFGAVYSRSMYRAPTKTARWSLTRQVVLDLAIVTLCYLAGISAYQWAGGAIPLPGLTPQDILPALLAIIVQLVLTFGVYAGYLWYGFSIQKRLSSATSLRPVIQLTFLGMMLPMLAHPFSILAAGLYTSEGWFTFAYFMVGLLLVAILSRQLSWAVEMSRQQSHLMEKLEQLGRAILSLTPGEQELTEALTEYVPQFLPSGRMVIWLVDTSQVVASHQDFIIDVDAVWAWIIGIKDTRAFRPDEPLPWINAPARHRPVIITPILDVEARVSIGFIYLEMQVRQTSRQIKSQEALFPFMQALAAQIASALNQSIMYQDRLEYHRNVQELEFAGRIQSSFLPDDIPIPEGWEFAVTLLPARETYGDYFDIISLPDGKLGVLVADVTDKGLGAALYMALSRTLIRTFAQDYDDQPDLVFFFTNERLLQDARASLFVTAFYGILDPQTGTLTYSSAGHNPQYILNRQSGTVKNILPPTGMPLGVEENTLWGQGSVEIEPGDVLLLYTDGIPDAQNEDGDFYETTRFVETSTRSLDLAPQEMQAAILADIQEHVGNAHQFDDITLLILGRNL